MDPLYLILSALIVVDAVTTSLVLSRGGVERNPLLRTLMQTTRWPWMVMMLTHSCFLIAVWWFRPGLVMTLLLTGSYVHAVVNNAMNLWTLRK